MNRIIIDDGRKHYEIADSAGNVRGEIAFNPSDFGLIERMKKLQERLTEYIDGIPEDATPEMLYEADLKIREELNTLFDSDVSTVIFGNTNCLTSCGGCSLLEKAIKSLIDIVTIELRNEVKKSNARINKYTKGIKNDRRTSNKH